MSENEKNLRDVRERGDFKIRSNQIRWIEMVLKVVLFFVLYFATAGIYLLF